MTKRKASTEANLLHRALDVLDFLIVPVCFTEATARVVPDHQQLKAGNSCHLVVVDETLLRGTDLVEHDYSFQRGSLYERNSSR